MIFREYIDTYLDYMKIGIAALLGAAGLFGVTAWIRMLVVSHNVKTDTIIGVCTGVGLGVVIAAAVLGLVWLFSHEGIAKAVVDTLLFAVLFIAFAVGIWQFALYLTTEDADYDPGAWSRMDRLLVSVLSFAVFIACALVIFLRRRAAEEVFLIEQ